MTLLNLEDWERMEQRPTPERDGPAIVGIGPSGRAAPGVRRARIWESGRTEALAVAPGIPSLEQQERRDRVPAGAYQDAGARGAAHGGRGPTSPDRGGAMGRRAGFVGPSGQDRL